MSAHAHRQPLREPLQRLAGVACVQVGLNQTQARAVGEGLAQGMVELAFAAGLIAFAAAEDLRQQVVVPGMDLVELVTARMQPAARCRNRDCPARSRSDETRSGRCSTVPCRSSERPRRPPARSAAAPAGRPSRPTPPARQSPSRCNRPAPETPSAGGSPDRWRRRGRRPMSAITTIDSSRLWFSRSDQAADRQRGVGLQLVFLVQRPRAVRAAAAGGRLMPAAIRPSRKSASSTPS